MMSTHLKMVVYLSLGLVCVFGWHFGTVLGLFGSAPQTRAELFLRFGVIMVIFVAVSALTGMFIARRDENAVMPDEREEKIELKVERVGLVVAYGGMLCLMWIAFTPLSPMQTANVLLVVMCVAELAKIFTGLFYLRTGA